MYGTYTLIDKTLKKIVDFSLVQVSEVFSRNAMENEGCQRSINKVSGQGIKFRSLKKDRHTQIKGEMRERNPQIVHEYDAWHLLKPVLETKAFNFIRHLMDDVMSSPSYHCTNSKAKQG